MKHYTVLPQYKNNKFVDTWIYWYKQFVCALDYEIWSLIDYLYIYNPNYLLFNQNEEGASYLAKEDLITLGLIEESSSTEGSSTTTSLTINTTKLLPHTGLINDYLQQYDKVIIDWTEEKDPRPFKEAEIIIFSSTDITQKTNPSKFFIGRLTAGNSFYIPKVLGKEIDFTFIKNAEEIYGNIQYFNLYIPRFNVNKVWKLEGNDKGIIFTNNLANPTDPTTSRGELRSENAFWTGHEQLNHNFYCLNNNNYEEIVTDSIQKTGFVNKHNPYYTINIENEQELPEKQEGKDEWIYYYIW
jgi:hypothetical protein